MSSAKGRRAVREEKIEAYFVERVEKAGGMAEKFTSPGKKGVPDRLVTWPMYSFGRMHLVELKTIGGALDPWQIRDHARRRKMGIFVTVIWTKKQVDEYVERYAIPPA